MTEEKKEKNGCCGGAKQLIIGLLLGALIFSLGYLLAKGGCPWGSKICPLLQR